MNKRKFFLLPICLLLLGACNLNQPESKESKEPEVSSQVDATSEKECEHNVETWEVSVIATCTLPGEESGVCTLCGKTVTRATDPLGHEWDDGAITTIPTVDAKGEKLFTCGRCGATKTEEMEKAKGINVTFTEGQHFEVWVYKTKAYTTEQPVKTNTCLARDENGNAIDFDANATLQPQVSFKVVCDEGYSVGVNNIEITGAKYKNLKQGPSVGDDGSADLPDNNHFRITKIQGDITVTITPIQGEQTKPEVKFVKNHCSVVVYKSETISNENIVAEGPFYARDKSTGEEVQTGGQIFFKVVPETGYVWRDAPTADVGDISTLAFIGRNSNKSGNKFKVPQAGVYNITKVEDDVTVLINCIPEAGEEGLGYTVTFVTQNCHVLIYPLQNYTFTPTAPVENKTLSRTSNGEAAKYVAAGEGVAEVKPQVNFLIVCDDGYTVAAANISISGTKGTEWNKCEQGDATLNPNIWKVTKIKADITITITASPAA